ncbi:MAG: hypothetical protein ACR2PJ_07355 [Pseudomonadales bacterium]
MKISTILQYCVLVVILATSLASCRDGCVERWEDARTGETGCLDDERN